MLRQEELAFVKAFSTPQLSPSILKELRMALSRRKKKPVVTAGIRSTTSASGARAPTVYRDCSQANAKPTS
jgi:isopentenyl diphosphate isomerase/L-lactate dehydrogenase-like FMN-dependent dehydrogenase